MHDTVIQFRGTIYENGYGLIAQKVMRDKDLTPTAKAIYAYICSFAGVGKDGERSAFPGVELMKKELGIKTNGSYYKHRKQLIDKGYITIEKQRKEGQRFDNNLYFIEAVPIEKEDKKPESENQTMEPLSDLPTAVLRTAEKETTNNNSLLSLTDFKKEEEEEEIITLGHVIAFLNEQINKREITNQKTITAIFEVAAKCKAIGTNDKKAMENYCITIIEDKMKSFGQKQSQPKQSNPKSRKQSTRKEPVPEWLENKNEDQKKETVQGDDDFTPEQLEEKRRLVERLKKYKKLG